MALTENGLLKGSFTGDDRIEESFVKKKLFNNTFPKNRTIGLAI